MTRTNVIFSAVDFVENLRKALGYPIPSIMKEKIKGMFDDAEFADFKGIEEDLKTTIYFADPHSPWQRGLNENTNDIIRFFFPKGTDFSLVDENELIKIIHLINSRPRKCLGFLSPLDFISKKCCT